jgi:arsenate reductase (thioredoxin)
MAEAIVNARFSNRWLAFSAGGHPKASVHPLVGRVLDEAGIPHHGTPKGIDSVKNTPYDLVITVCGADDEDCPVWFGPGIQIHHAYKDPSKVEGTEAEKLAAFRKLRDEMAAELPYLLEKNDAGKMES